MEGEVGMKSGRRNKVKGRAERENEIKRGRKSRK